MRGRSSAAEHSARTMVRLFGLGDDSRVERFLGGMSARGWHLREVGGWGLVFRFVKGEPREYVYRQDLKTTSDADLAGYLALFEAAGWEYVGRGMLRKYFRHEASAEPVELYTDGESRLERLRSAGVVLLLGVILALVAAADFLLLALGLYIELYRIYAAAVVPGLVFLLAFAAGCRDLARLALVIRRLKRKART